MSTRQQTARVIIGIVESCESSSCCDLCTNEIVSQINNLLSPVRECLEGLAVSVLDGQMCWCPDFCEPHTKECLAAQQLWERLKIQ